MIALAILSAVFFICALAYWIWQAHKQAMEDRKVFSARPQSPASRDMQYLEQQRRDAELVAEWRIRVADNLRRREERREPPALLRRQCGPLI